MCFGVHENGIETRNHYIFDLFTNTENPRVGSSILSLGIYKFKGLRSLNASPFIFCSKIVVISADASQTNPIIGRHDYDMHGHLSISVRRVGH